MKPCRSRVLPVLALVAVVGVTTLGILRPASARTAIVVGVPVTPPPPAVVYAAPVVIVPSPRVVAPAPVLVLPRPHRPHAHRWHHWQRW
jgi:hypothetical protein